MKISQALLLIFFIVGCQDSNNQKVPSQPRFDMETELAAIETFRSDFEQAIKEQRFSEMGKFTTSDMMAVNPGSEEWKRFRELRKNPIGQFSYDSIRLWPIETEILNDSMAYDFGTSSVYYTDKNGKSQELKASLMVLIKKTKDGWKLFREVTSATVN